MQGTYHKKIELSLTLGILLFPIIFAWFTLRQGYSNLTRIISFAWLILYLVIALFIITPNEAESETTSTNNPELPISSADANAKYGSPAAIGITFTYENPSDKKVYVNVYRRGDSENCQTKTEFGALIKKFTLTSTNPSSEIFYEAGQFCVSVADHSDETYANYYGPFLDSTTCSFAVRYEPDLFNFYYNILLMIPNNCFPTNKMGVGLNMNDGFNGFATFSPSCDVENYENRTFLPINGVTHVGIDANIPFCIRLESYGEKAYFGPYFAKQDCTLTIPNLNDVSDIVINDTENSTHSCSQPTDKTYMNFISIGKQYRIILNETINESCMNPKEGEEIVNVYLPEGQTIPVFVSKLSATGKFCLTVVKGTKNKYYGPFPKDNFYNFEIEDTELVKWCYKKHDVPVCEHQTPHN